MNQNNEYKPTDGIKRGGKYSSGEKLKQSRKCEITGNWCANENYPKDHPCKCNQCQAYLCETIDHLDRLAEESMKIYENYTATKCKIHEALRLIESDADPGKPFKETRAYRLIWDALRTP